MKTKSLGFIGGGRITKMFLQAFANKKEEFKSVIVCDTNPEVLSVLKNLYPYIKTVDSAYLAARQDIVFIALHPHLIMDTLEKIKVEVSGNTSIISLAPKITIEKIAVKLGKVKTIVRSIPNAGSYINEGYNPVCIHEGISLTDKQQLLEILNLLGHTFEVAESKLESYAIMSAMLPTYFWFQWKELVEIGQKTGLSESECKDSIQQTIIASMNLMFRSGLNNAQVMDLIPIKPIGEHEAQIADCFKSKLLSLFEKIKP